MRALLLDMGCWNDLRGQVEPFTEVVKTLRGQGIVVPLPGKLSLQESTRRQRLASFDDL